MEYRQLGNTKLKVSLIGLGTMTWGEQNSEPEAFEQLDAAMEAGINFIDTAELYPVEPRAETYGRTERYLGNWIKKRNNRDRIILATKVVSRAEWLPYIRGGNPRLDRNNIEMALNTSLQRLQTEYIDLYQLHWPERKTNFFGELGYCHYNDNEPVPLEETLEALDDIVASGKVRYIGISNETPWGAMRLLHLAEQLNLPRIVSIQNPYNLLNRTFEIGLAEIAHREQLGLLAYSPLAFGVLSGKYLNGAQPAGTRLALFDRFTRYSNPETEQATAQYVELAHTHGLDPTQMALAYVNSRAFLTSTIIGATSMEQLHSNIDSIHLKLPAEVLQGIERIHTSQPNPSP